jgi:hypothetical protein
MTTQLRFYNASLNVSRYHSCLSIPRGRVAATRAWLRLLGVFREVHNGNSTRAREASEAVDYWSPVEAGRNPAASQLVTQMDARGFEVASVVESVVLAVVVRACHVVRRRCGVHSQAASRIQSLSRRGSSTHASTCWGPAVEGTQYKTLACILGYASQDLLCEQYTKRNNVASIRQKGKLRK